MDNNNQVRKGPYAYLTKEQSDFLKARAVAMYGNQEKAAIACGVPKNNWDMIVNGYNRPIIDRAIMIAKGLKLPVEKAFPLTAMPHVPNAGKPSLPQPNVT
jgi:hypothetical protein